MEKIRKNIDLTPGAVKAITVEAAKKSTNFKILAQQVLEDFAVKVGKKGLMVLMALAMASCSKEVTGCMDSTAKNYDPKATKDNSTCEYKVRHYVDNWNSVPFPQPLIWPKEQSTSIENVKIILPDGDYIIPCTLGKKDYAPNGIIFTVKTIYQPGGYYLEILAVRGDGQTGTPFTGTYPMPGSVVVTYDISD